VTAEFRLDDGQAACNRRGMREVTSAPAQRVMMMLIAIVIEKANKSRG
jgi:hypothetical protein